VDPGGVVATVPVETVAVASPVVVSTVTVPSEVLAETLSEVPEVDPDWKLNVATVLPLGSCTKQPKCTPWAESVTDTFPDESAVPEPAAAGVANVTQ
jgi:hypothetical protein